MTSCKRIAGLVVVKIISVKVNNLKVSSMVLVVARCALSVFYLLARMVTAPGANQTPDLVVTVKTFAVQDLFTQFVAFGAVGDALKPGVSTRQFAW